jgi:predicted  nucleic acid-binding Zn-ribbon protein
MSGGKKVQSERRKIIMDNELIKAIRQVVKEEVLGIKNEVSGLKEDVSGFKEDVSGIKKQLSENTSILKALEHASQVHKAELDNLNIKVAKLSGNEEKIKKLEDNLNHHEHDIIIKTGKTKVS